MNVYTRYLALNLDRSKCEKFEHDLARLKKYSHIKAIVIMSILILAALTVSAGIYSNTRLGFSICLISGKLTLLTLSIWTGVDAFCTILEQKVADLKENAEALLPTPMVLKASEVTDNRGKSLLERFSEIIRSGVDTFTVYFNPKVSNSALLFRLSRNIDGVPPQLVEDLLSVMFPEPQLYRQVASDEENSAPLPRIEDAVMLIYDLKNYIDDREKYNYNKRSRTE